MAFLFLTMLMMLSASTTTSDSNITKTGIFAKPGCQSTCGNVTVSYPFGIGHGSGCSLNSSQWFDVTCNTSFNPPKAFLRKSNIEIREIGHSYMRIANVMAKKCYTQTGDSNDSYSLFANFLYSPFTFSYLNDFTVVGCDDRALITDSKEKHYRGGCSSECFNAKDVLDYGCYGIGCCRVLIPKGLKYFYAQLESISNHTRVWSFNRCSYAFLGEKDRFKFRGASDLSDPTFMERTIDSVPVLIDWVIANQTCDEARKSNLYACQSNTNCINSTSGLGGYTCTCREGFEGNPYLSPGCQHIDECANPNNKLCEKICTNTIGSYYCSCPHGYYGNGKVNSQGCIAENSKFPVIKFSLGVGFGFLALMVGVSILYFTIKRRTLIKKREKFFQRNGGLLLTQHITPDSSGVQSSTHVFKAEELEKATNNYAADKIVGHGGYGTVYRGVLPDLRVVAIKKSKVMDESQVEQFINKLLILSKINHRHVVKLLGCCLETEVPLLVYEYVPNGTLFQHIHNSRGDARLSLENRLRIAIESADALAYLHSAASMPVIHRDVKSANILLDENYATKISDFGASRLVPVDQTQITTLVQGTLGYLDPEYFHTSQLTDKSDVYSFGVVLAELFTGRKPLLLEGPAEEKNLATYFITSVKENRLFEILDPRVVSEGSLEQLKAAGELVKKCLCLNCEERPPMKEVAMQLEGLRKYTKHCCADDSRRQEEATTSKGAGVSSDLYSFSVDRQSTTGEDISRQDFVETK